MPGLGRKFTAGEDRAILDLAAKGWSAAAIARELGRNPSGVLQHANRKLGLAFPRRRVAGRIIPRISAGPGRRRRGRQKVKTVVRECLGCGHEFYSVGIYNRLCRNCRETSARMAEVLPANINLRHYAGARTGGGAS